MFRSLVFTQRHIYIYIIIFVRLLLCVCSPIVSSVSLSHSSIFILNKDISSIRTDSSLTHAQDVTFSIGFIPTITYNQSNSFLFYLDNEEKRPIH